MRKVERGKYCKHSSHQPQTFRPTEHDVACDSGLTHWWKPGQHCNVPPPCKHFGNGEMNKILAEINVALHDGKVVPPESTTWRARTADVRATLHILVRSVVESAN